MAKIDENSIAKLKALFQDNEKALGANFSQLIDFFNNNKVTDNGDGTFTVGNTIINVNDIVQGADVQSIIRSQLIYSPDLVNKDQLATKADTSAIDPSVMVKRTLTADDDVLALDPGTYYAWGVKPKNFPALVSWSTVVVKTVGNQPIDGKNVTITDINASQLVNTYSGNASTGKWSGWRVPNSTTMASKSDVTTAVSAATANMADDSKVAHLSGANNFDTVPTVDNNPLLLANSLPSDPAFVELQTQVDNQKNDLNNSINSKLAQISSVPETFANLAALQAKYPNGKTGLFVTADNGHKYIWANNVWTDAGVYQSVGIAEKSLTAPMTNFLIKASILTDDIPVKIDKSLKSNIGISFDGALLDNPDNIVWYKVPVTGGRSYSAYYHEIPKLPTQLVIMEFQNGISAKRYSVPGDNPTFIVDPATDYVHISLASNKADYTAVKIILSEASSRIGKNAVETDNNWEARLTKSESEIDILTDKYLSRIKSGNSFVKSIGGFLPLSTDNVSADVSGLVNFSNKQRFADNSVRINSIYSSKSGRFKIDLGGTKSFEDLTLVFFSPVETNPDVTVKCSVSQDGAYSDALPATSINGSYSTGWNYVKLTPSFFRRLPTTANAIYLTITSRDSKTDGEIYGTLYLDSIIFDLKQMPVVCLSFDQLHQESFDNGAYQYLLNSGLPFSLYCRGWDDTSLVSAEWLDWAKNAEYKYGAELGVYGSYGDAQWAVNGATDYDSAKVNLAASWSAFFKTFGHAPATYASAQAFTSEFSLRAAKDVGFKIVRGGQLNMLNAYLDKDTMQLPMTSLSYNTNADNIKNKIDTAVQYGYQLNLFTHGAYDNASDSDYLKLADFKSMIDYLVKQRALGKIKVLTIEDYVTQAIKGVS